MQKILIFASLILVMAFSPSANAQNVFDVGDDRFLSGSAPVHNSDGVDDLFIAGNHVRSESAISGSANVVGRKVELNAAIGGDAYVAGWKISIKGPVSGDVTAAGYKVNVGSVAGDLRISGKKLSITGPTDGYAVVTGDEVEFAAQVEGDVSLTARKISFSDDARIDGNLIIFGTEANAFEIPQSVVPVSRIEWRALADENGYPEETSIWNQNNPVVNFLKRFLVVGLLAALLTAITPGISSTLKQHALSRPVSTLLLGFFTLAAAIGSAIVLLITGAGFFLAPVPILIAFLCAIGGYLFGVYFFGAGIMSLTGKAGHDRFFQRFSTAFVGALAATFVSIIPVVSWLGTLSIAFVGIGALSVLIIRPKFFVKA